MLSVILPNVAFFYCYAESRYAECRYVECRGAFTTVCRFEKLEQFGRSTGTGVVNVAAPSSLKGAAAFWPKGTEPNAPYRETQLIFFTFSVNCYETFHGRNLLMFVTS